MSSILNIGIEVTPEVLAAIKLHDKSGKKFLNLTAHERKEVGQYGHTHYITLSQTKEEREAKAPKVFCGDAKQFTFEDRKVAPVQSVEEDDSLPF